MKKWCKRLVIVFIIGIAYLAGLYLLQNHLLFFPSRHYISPQEIGLEDFAEISLTASDGHPIRLWYATGDKTKPAVLFLHGNAGQIATFAPQLHVLVQAGYGVLAMEYRGFAEVPGSIRQTTIFNDAAHAFDFLKEQGYSRNVVYGYSFGAAFSLGLTSLRSVDGLILTAPFYSLNKIVGEKPVPFARWVLKDEYPSYQYIAQFTKPLLIVHGKQDGLIPYRHAESLFNNAVTNDKQLYVLEGQNHNTIYFEGANLPYILDYLEKIQK